MADRSLPTPERPGSRSLPRGILPGLLPLCVVIGALILKYLYGFCGNDLILSVQEIAVVLWGAEMLLGLLGLFSRHWRFLATSLVITLLLSALLVWPLVLLSSWLLPLVSPPFCHFRN